MKSMRPADVLGNALSPYTTNARTQLHRVSAILRGAGVHPYVWRNAELSTLFRNLDGRGAFGILGIACIPELAWGMRACMKRKIPVVGIPLDANRCMRWMGRFEETSVNLERLSELVN
jgi:hypothetical protein